MVAGREDGHAYSPETLSEAVARGGSTAGHMQARAIMPLARWLGSPIFRSVEMIKVARPGRGVRGPSSRGCIYLVTELIWADERS